MGLWLWPRVPRGRMISLKKYLETVGSSPDDVEETVGEDVLPATVAAFRSALLEMGSCSLEACPALGNELNRRLRDLQERLGERVCRETVDATATGVREQLRDWGANTARHYQQKTDEVKEILIVMAHTAESVGQRDQRCAAQINEVTERLKKVANLEDLTEIRASIESGATELKTSIDRMTAEGKAAIDQLRAEVATFQARLEEAEQAAARDALTGLRSRVSVAGEIERRIEAGSRFCAAVVDIDHFKQVNDQYGHVFGDEILRQFALELKSACRSTDTVGRWGGDEFIILLDCDLSEAAGRTERLSKWICGSYTIDQGPGQMKLEMEASIGLAEHVPGETQKELLARADAEMYRYKAASRLGRAGSKRLD